MSDRIDIQVQDQTGNWRTFANTMNDPQLILARMKELKDRFPDKRIRAIDTNGRIMDMLP